MTASPWEKEDAIHEDIPIRNFCAGRFDARQWQAHRRHLQKVKADTTHWPGSPGASASLTRPFLATTYLWRSIQENALPLVEARLRRRITV